MPKSKILGFLFVSCITFQLFARDVMLELKGAYFLPINSRFRECYKGSALFGPELTVQLWKDKNWYAFASVDYLKKDGRRLSLCDSKKLQLLPLAIGLKYFVPVSHHARIYLGLGFQPTYIHITGKRACVTSKETQWGYGAVGKIGAHVTLPHKFLLDLFFNASVVRISKHTFYGNTVTHSKTHLSGAVFGAALGYRF